MDIKLKSNVKIIHNTVQWLSMNFEAVTARYVDVRLERKKEVIDAYEKSK